MTLSYPTAVSGMSPTKTVGAESVSDHIETVDQPRTRPYSGVGVCTARRARAAGDAGHRSARFGRERIVEFVRVNAV